MTEKFVVEKFSLGLLDSQRLGAAVENEEQGRGAELGRRCDEQAYVLL